MLTDLSEDIGCQELTDRLDKIRLIPHFSPKESILISNKGSPKRDEKIKLALPSSSFRIRQQHKKTFKLVSELSIIKSEELDSVSDESSSNCLVQLKKSSKVMGMNGILQSSSRTHFRSKKLFSSTLQQSFVKIPPRGISPDKFNS
ncbi:unnamed protein product [Moneuplotes crassus]|uniref:Uncharacterized protein n=1 Tax=Euplotes crassus TaxID=5936 RepID=A0AAD1UK97_EUPCR|nr:unnamed protein product [Moneuplotes crassus]